MHDSHEGSGKRTIKSVLRQITVAENKELNFLAYVVNGCILTFPLGLCFSARKCESMRNGRRSFHVTHGVTNPHFQVRDQRADRFMAILYGPVWTERPGAFSIPAFCLLLQRGQN